MFQLSKNLTSKLAMLFVGGASLCYSADQIKGTVYGDSSGPSGAGTGEVRIATEQCILDLSYQKPVSREFAGPVCEEIGAFWVVEGKITHPGIGELSRVRCDGTYDSSIHSAWLVAKKFLQLTALHSYSRANQLRSTRAAKSAFSEDSAKPELLDLESYRSYGGAGKCLSVRLKEDDRTVVIQAGSSCFIKQDGNPVSLSLRIVDEGSQKGWRIDKIASLR